MVSYIRRAAVALGVRARLAFRMPCVRFPSGPKFTQFSSHLDHFTFTLFAPSAILRDVSCLRRRTPDFRPAEYYSRLHRSTSKCVLPREVSEGQANGATFMMYVFFFYIFRTSTSLHAVSACMKSMHEIYYGDICYFGVLRSVSYIIICPRPAWCMRACSSTSPFKVWIFILLSIRMRQSVSHGCKCRLAFGRWTSLV